MSDITVVPSVSPIQVVEGSTSVEVHMTNVPVSVIVSEHPIEFPQVVEADSQEQEDALFAAGAKIVIRTDLL